MADYQVVRLKKGKNKFEILTERGAVLLYRKGTKTQRETVAGDFVYKNASSSDKASDSELATAFGTSDINEIIKTILDDGELQLTTAERAEAVAAKRLEVINYIHKYYIDPKAKIPHPVERIRLAMDSAKIKVDGDKTVENQIQTIVSALVSVIPLRKCEMEGVITLTHSGMGAGLGVVHGLCEVRRDQYDSEGCTLDVTLIPGDFDTLLQRLERACPGEYSFNVYSADQPSPSK